MEKEIIGQRIKTQKLRAKQEMIVEIGFVCFRIRIKKTRVEEWFARQVPVLTLADLLLFVKLERFVQQKQEDPA